MNREKLVSELYKNVDSLDDIESDDIAEYLLDHYHLIPKTAKCYEGEIKSKVNCISGASVFYIGDNCVHDIFLVSGNGYARLFIEEER
jgi:hypothetical protein